MDWKSPSRVKSWNCFVFSCEVGVAGGSDCMLVSSCEMRFLVCWLSVVGASRLG